MLKYITAKQILAKYAGTGGKCVDDPSVDLFVRKVLQYLLFQGTHGNERKFCFQAQNRCITLPQELETPLKVRIDGEVKSIWNRWFEYHSGVDVDNACDADNSLLEDPNRYATVYDMCSSSYIGIKGNCLESEDAHVIVKGLDANGREIFTQHKGQKISGEYLSIKKNKIVRSEMVFSQVTEVSKTVTNGYVQLISMDSTGLARGFLAEYGPYDETPSYRRMKILLSPCPNICTISILGRIRLKDYYADEDLIPFDNLFLLETAGQTVNSMRTKDIQNALAQDGYVKGLIETEGNYKKINNGQPIEVFRGLSAGLAMSAQRAGRKLFSRRRIG